MNSIKKAYKLDNVCYDIRGPLLKRTPKSEDGGQRILKLNIGNPAPFGFDAPEEALIDAIKTYQSAGTIVRAKGFFLHVKQSCRTY